MVSLRIGIVDTGVNPWHSHAGGRIAGCRIFVCDRIEAHCKQVTVGKAKVRWGKLTDDDLDVVADRRLGKQGR